MDAALNPRDLIARLQKCSKDGADHCRGCPYDHPEYEKGCGKLLADAARLLEIAFPAEIPEQERTCKNCSKVCIADEGGWVEGKTSCPSWEQKRFY